MIDAIYDDDLHLMSPTKKDNNSAKKGVELLTATEDAMNTGRDKHQKIFL
jgi:hypothetical protein